MQWTWNKFIYYTVFICVHVQFLFFFHKAPAFKGIIFQVNVLDFLIAQALTYVSKYTCQCSLLVYYLELNYLSESKIVTGRH